MSPTREFRILDHEDDEWLTCDCWENASLELAALEADEAHYGPFRIQARAVTDWTDLATEAATESPAAA